MLISGGKFRGINLYLKNPPEEKERYIVNNIYLCPEEHPEHHHLNQPFHNEEGTDWKSWPSSETNNPEMGA